ncbi:MAG: helix-turn-helix transcriptional regulator [Chloroflexota bacterium]|nr:helix-turn-helix transcriptional regulator [Chloroflexota bacterium]
MSNNESKNGQPKGLDPQPNGLNPQPKQLPTLTPREKAALELLVKGCGKPQIAQQLQIGERTVDRIIANLAAKFAEIDPVLIETKGTLGRIARIVALYTSRYKFPPPSTEETVTTWPLLRLSIRSEIEVDFDQTRNETELRIECLQDKVALTSHGIIIDDRSPQATVLPNSLEVGSHSNRVKVTHRLILEDEKRPLFQVWFDPPLTRGQQLSYYYYVNHATYFPMSREELANRIKAEQYPLEEMLCEKSYTISSPTKHLYLRLTFPPHFQIEAEQILVEVGRGGPPDQNEMERISHTGAYAKKIFGRRTSLILDLDNPVLSRRYRIRWQPLA